MHRHLVLFLSDVVFNWFMDHMCILIVWPSRRNNERENIGRRATPNESVNYTMYRNMLRAHSLSSLIDVPHPHFTYELVLRD